MYFSVFFFNDTATTEIYTLSLHDALPIFQDLVLLPCYQWNRCIVTPPEHPLLKEKPLTLEAIARYPIVTYDFRSEEHTSELQSPCNLVCRLLLEKKHATHSDRSKRLTEHL